MSAEEVDADDGRDYWHLVEVSRRLLAGWRPVHHDPEGWRWSRMGDAPIPLSVDDIGAMSDIWWQDEEPAEPPRDQCRVLLAKIVDGSRSQFIEQRDGGWALGFGTTRLTPDEVALLASLAPSSPRGETPDA